MTTAAMQVPIITKRHRIPTDAIQDTVQQIVDHFHPLRVILFGSYAYGQPLPESDVDLLVVMETQLSETEQAIQILKKLNYSFGLDLIVKTPQTLARRLAWGDQFLLEITQKGLIVYESSNR